MHTPDWIKTALTLPPDERLALVDELLRSLDQPHPEVAQTWIEEAERRLALYRAGKTRTIPAEDVVGPL